MIMSKNKLMITVMALLTTISIGGVIFAYANNTPEIAVLISTASALFNFTARAKLVTV